MEDLMTAAQDNDVGRLRQLLKSRKRAHHGESNEQISSDSLQKICKIEVQNNNTAAVSIFLNEGAEIERGASFDQHPDFYIKLVVCLPKFATISVAAYSGSIEVFR